MTFSCPVTLAEAAQGLDRRLAPDEAQRAAIARDLDILALESLEADVRTKDWFDGAEVSGTWSARIAQTCGVTLERLDSQLSGDFVIHVVPEGSIHASEGDGAEDFDPDAIDPPDISSDGKIDLCAYVIEHLALEIDPFARKPDAEFTPPDPGPDLSPFAVLRKLKGDDQG